MIACVRAVVLTARRGPLTTLEAGLLCHPPLDRLVGLAENKLLVFNVKECPVFLRCLGIALDGKERLVKRCWPSSKKPYETVPTGRLAKALPARSRVGWASCVCHT